MKDTLKRGSRGADTRYLQTILNALGAELVVDGTFGDKTHDAVVEFQFMHKLTCDGVVGPKTWGAIDQALARKKVMDAMPPKAPEPPARKTDEDLRKAGEKAVERALSMWKLDIYDPKPNDDTQLSVASKQYIDDMIQSGLGWTWEPAYAGDGDFEWCGAFAATCWSDIKAAIRKLYFASTFRLDRYASYRTCFGEKPDATPDEDARRRECPDGEEAYEPMIEPRAGDIILVGKKGYGTHICLVESYNPETGVFNTIEGNAYGLGPHSERQQGVVKSSRGMDEVRRIIRPGVDDLA